MGGQGAHSLTGRHATVGDVPLRLMIVDDSIVARTVFSHILEARPEFDIVAVARDADQALATLSRLSVDIILLDLNMPGRDGLSALPDLLARSRGARVLIVSSMATDGAAATMQALTLGATDTLAKPSAGELGADFGDRLATRLLRIGRAKRVQPHVLPTIVQAAVRPCRTDPVACLGIGASTGGLHALAALFAAIPRTFRAPILVAQHLPTAFMPYFADQLSTMSGRPVRVARDGDGLMPGAVLVAPGDAHLTLVRYRDRIHALLDTTPQPSGCQPSVDPMLTSIAGLFGAGAVGVILSGMGRDGLIGAGHVHDAGGEMLVQDAATATIWGMPGAVAQAGIADAILPPDAIGARIVARPAPTEDSEPWR